MSIDVLGYMPPDWKVDVAVLRPGGTDGRGYPLPAVEHTVVGCLVGWRATQDPVDRTDLVEATAVLYAPPGADVTSTDRVRVPGQGTWAVDGEPKPWPMGLEVPLRREGGG